ncbi:hypothetical protein BHM03_00024116, partial [Ensete ventricosum]
MHQTTVWWPLFDRSARVTVVCREEPRWEHVPGPTTTLRQSASPSGAPSLLPCSSRVSCVRPSPSHFCEPHPLFPLQLMPATSPLQNPIASANPNPSAAMYSPQMASYYYQQLYGPTSPSAVGPPPYHHHYHPQMGYSMQSSLRAGSPSLAQGPRPPYMQQQQLQHPAPHLQGTFIPSSSQHHPFQLQPPPQARQPLSTAV